MSFRVAIARRAAREIAEQYDWIAAQRSRAAANRWRDSLLLAINSLEENPERCPEAPEAEWFGGGLRQFLHGKRPRVNRILFEVRGDVVVVLRVRHNAQDVLGPDDL